MRDGGFISIGWRDVPDLWEVIGQRKTTAKNRIRHFILPTNANSTGVASRKAGESLNFAQEIAEKDLVLACEGQTVARGGRVTGPHEFDQNLRFHTSALSNGCCLIREVCQIRKSHIPRSTNWKKAGNRLELEQRGAPQAPQSNPPYARGAKSPIVLRRVTATILSVADRGRFCGAKVR